MKRTISPMALLFASVSAILGSGWLFSAFLTAKIAGPAALAAWVIGGLIMMGIAFVFAELCAMIPITGSSTRIPQFTHGTIVSFLFAWMIWISYLSFSPAEVQAVLQYTSFYFPSLVHPHGGLAKHGYIAATVLMLVISSLNTYSLLWLIRSNNFLTLMKIAIPLILTISVLVVILSPHHLLHPANSKFMPYGWHGIFGSLSTGGIVFAFNGFKQAAEMAGEAKNPNKALPFAIIGSITVCLIIFLLLEMAFLTSLTPANLAHGWRHIHLSDNNSPLAAILASDHLNIILPFLYVGAIIAPLAAALMYCGSASRSLYAMSKNGYLPRFFQDVTAQGNPAYAILFNFVIGMCMFAPLPGWDKMVAFLTSLIAVTYGIAPICLLSLRYKLPNHKRPFRLPLAIVWSYLAFLVCTLLAYWSGWQVIYKMDIGIIIGFIVLFAYHFLTKRGRKLQVNWKSSLWVYLYFSGLSILSYYGNYNGGKGVLSEATELPIMSIFCAAILGLAIWVSLPKERIEQYIQDNLGKDELVL